MLAKNRNTTNQCSFLDEVGLCSFCWILVNMILPQMALLVLKTPGLGNEVTPKYDTLCFFERRMPFHITTLIEVITIMHSILYCFFFFSFLTQQANWQGKISRVPGCRHQRPQPEVLDQNQKSQIPLQKKLFLTEDPKSYNFPVLSLNMFLFIYLCF